MDQKTKTILLSLVAVAAVALVVWQAIGFVRGPQEEVVGSLGDLSGERGSVPQQPQEPRPEPGAEGKVDASGAPPGAPGG